jgi:arabinogalactan oligomer/maltooligosaccharide transport system permease protein
MNKFPRSLLILSYLILILASVLVLYPVLRVVATSIRPFDRIMTYGLSLIPDDADLSNYVRLIRDTDFLLWLANSLGVTAVTSWLSVSIAAMSAYGLTRRNFRGRNAVLISIFLTQLIPGSVLIVPTYLMILRLELVNSFIGIIFAYSVSGITFSIWLIRGYFRGIPVEAEEAAMMDGAGPLRIFAQVLLPQAMPILAVVFIMSMLGGWSEFILARFILIEASMFTWPLGLNRFTGQYRTLWGIYSAAAVLVSIPAAAVFYAMGGHLQEGLARGSGGGSGKASR